MLAPFSLYSSGARHFSVPGLPSIVVWSCPLTSLDMPKSARYTRLAFSRMLDGLISRWRTSLEWQYAIARATQPTTPRRNSNGHLAGESMIWSSVEGSIALKSFSPSASSLAMMSSRSPLPVRIASRLSSRVSRSQTAAGQMSRHSSWGRGMYAATSFTTWRWSSLLMVRPSWRRSSIVRPRRRMMRLRARQTVPWATLSTRPKAPPPK